MSTEFFNKFALNLKKTREEKGLSQTDLAEKTSLQPSAISHFETGRRAPSFDNLRRLADALEVTSDFLLGREIDPTASGPTIQTIFKDAQKLSDEDREKLAEFARYLASKNKQ